MWYRDVRFSELDVELELGLALFLASSSAISFPRIFECPGIHRIVVSTPLSRRLWASIIHFWTISLPGPKSCIFWSLYIAAWLSV
jgi:hypothetical protein